MRFRLLTYNMHKGIGGIDRRYVPDRVIEAIRHCEPDIVFLQEVDDGVPRSRLDRQVDLVADALEMRHRVYQPNVRLKQGRYGNAILSHFNLSDVRDIDLTVPLKKRRQALVAHCRVRAGGQSRTVVLLNVHLGLAGFERTVQVKRILASDLIQHVHHDTGIVIAGDFNDVWGTLGRRLLKPAAFDSASGNWRTFPAVLPVRALDRVYYRGKLAVHHSFASRTRVARQASDHLPLVVDFEMLELPGS
jgi:endonuclease/exonuclease/phosphatase family metal-dependent hydrolase